MTASLCDILPSVAALLGVPNAIDVLDLGSQSDARRIGLVLVDGLGLHLLPELAPHAPLLASVLAGGTGRLTALESTFPSTTPTSLVSLATGVRPGEHGVLGFTVNVPGTDRVLTHITWRDDPEPDVWQPVPTWFERSAAAGVPVTAVLPVEFLGSGLTRAAYRGARFAWLLSGEDPAERVGYELREVGGLVYGYTAELDTAAHVHGIASPQWRRAAASVDGLLTRILERLPADALLVVTADHGGLDISPAGRLDLAKEPELQDGVRVTAGEPRVRYLHTVEGAVDDVLAAWRARLGPRALVQSRNEAVAHGWFGAVPPEHMPRLGDVVVVCRGDTAIFDSAHEPREVLSLIGFHGADSPVETAIPLITLTP
ncbi:alkaline phosphatase family protein [uncultured Jatrophihabitans sp.]|uniref:alkaline phosphatase family protein n=1 Tax=uncultured Jatrophihabitans sp. TaxID=1610747 RepID=UPI0035CA21B3